MKQAFYINNQFLVNPSLNTVTDKEKNEQTRIEPRLMSLLCILSEDAGQVVPRETIIKEIWNDYGGADEGLNQAISFLRKILNDGDKKLIETVPKKGYILNASITSEPEITPIESSVHVEEKPRRRRSFLIPLAVVLLISLWLIFRHKPVRSTSPDVLNKDEISDTSGVKNQPSNSSDISPDVLKRNDSTRSDFQKKSAQ
jgi:DNA-binding winged helix-turn-helix (wHTH) protein